MTFLRKFWFLAIPLTCAIGGFVLLPSACSSPAKEATGHARNAAIGSEHALELDGCLLKAASFDAGSEGGPPDGGRYALYDACADGVDRKYGRKDGGP